MNQPPFMNAATVAENLSVSVATVHRWAKIGVIPSGKRVAGGLRLWQWSEVEKSLGLAPKDTTQSLIERIRNAKREERPGRKHSERHSGLSRER